MFNVKAVVDVVSSKLLSVLFRRSVGFWGFLFGFGFV